MSTQTRIRLAELSDVAEISAIHVACWHEVYGAFMPSELLAARGIGRRVAQWSERVSAYDHGVYVLEDAGAGCIGFAVAQANADPAIACPGEFHACYIRPAARGGDAGPVAMRALAMHLRLRDLWPACVWAFRGNPYRRIYPALGCRPVVLRDRVIEGYSVPEIGYVVPDFGQLITRLEAMIASAALRRTG